MGTETVNRGKGKLSYLESVFPWGISTALMAFWAFVFCAVGEGQNRCILLFRIYPSPLKANYGRLQIGWIALKIAPLIRAVTLAIRYINV
jgi:hypothetical protein